MKRSVKLKKQYGNDSLYNVFQLEKRVPAVSLESVDFSGKETVCIVLEDGMNDDLAKKLSATKEARVYVLVPHIDESKYSKLRGKAIVREVPNIKGNYCIIDSEALLLFDKSMKGIAVKSQDAISTVKKIFEREFWENAKEEFIETKRPCAERTFDVPPVYGSDDVIIDDGFGNTTPLKQSIDNAEAVAYTGKVSAGANHDIILNDIAANSGYLKAYSKENVYYYPQLPFCFFVSSGTAYFVNFDIAQYDKLPERAKGRLFAVKIGNVNLGDYYKFNKHKTIGDLVGQTVIDADGKSIEIKDCAEETRKISVDLRMARGFKRMESDPKILEARLEKRDANLLTTNHIAKQVIFNIELQIQPKTFSKKADVYKQFEEANKEYSAKRKELGAFVDKLKDGGTKKSYSALSNGNFETVRDYKIAAEALNLLIDEINNEDSLGELLGGKKTRKAIAKLKIAQLSMDIPKYGDLYQKGSKYEYALKSANELDLAMTEMEEAGVNNTDVVYLEDE